MTEGSEGKVAERRGFLRALGLAAGTAAAAAAPAAAQRSDTVPAGQARKENEGQRIAARYRESDHVKAYYRTNRYEQ
ncbi:MAG: twin-arginine translocation signal domain-containing protein [Acetobacteraceae bacterium]|nr:twin-arginine translocation signal domain-containing protein [Acetobacteraceae bacterium]